MNLRSLLSAAVAFTMAWQVSALDINNTAGTLSQALEGDVDVTSLRITGTIDAADFNFINDNLKSLQSLDLSGASISAYEGPLTLAGGYNYAANQLPPYALFGSPVTSVTLPTGITAIGESALAATGITSIAIPASVTEIGDNAFASCTALTSVTIPATVTSLGDNLFIDCTALTSATVNSPVAELPARMFDGCSRLATVVTPATLTTIGNRAFAACQALTSFTFAPTITGIGEQAFYSSGINTVDLTKSTGLREVGNFAFAKCLRLTSASFADTAFNLGEGVFFDDIVLHNVTLPSSTSVIPAFTFKGTANIDASSALPKSTTIIGDYALTGWTRVSEFTFPRSLTALGSGAMADWTALTKLDASKLSGVPTLGEEVWDNVDCADIILYVDTDYFEDFKAADQWCEFKVTLKTTESGAVTIPGAETPDVTFTFDGNYLVITSTVEPIVNVNLYDLTGRRRYSHSDNANRVLVDTSAWERAVLIADVTLADNSRSVIKITR